MTSGGERARLAEELERRLVELERPPSLTACIVPGLLYWAGMRLLFPRLGDEGFKDQRSLSTPNI